MIAIVDYGLGNLRSVQKAFERLGGPPRSRGPDASRRRGGVVLPGPARSAHAQPPAAGLVEPVRARSGGRPFLGICLGLAAPVRGERGVRPVRASASSRARCGASRDRA